MDRVSRETGSRLRMVSLTVLRWVFICWSTPEEGGKEGEEDEGSDDPQIGRLRDLESIPWLLRSDSPVTVPCTMDPFLSSIVTLSLLSFIKNLQTEREREECCVSASSSTVYIPSLPPSLLAPSPSVLCGTSLLASTAKSLSEAAILSPLKGLLRCHPILDLPDELHIGYTPVGRRIVENLLSWPAG
jgi:hypothetical protein